MAGTIGPARKQTNHVAPARPTSPTLRPGQWTWRTSPAAEEVRTQSRKAHAYPTGANQSRAKMLQLSVFGSVDSELSKWGSDSRVMVTRSDSANASPATRGKA